MQLSEYIKGLQAVLETHGDMLAVYAEDDEGNYFSPVYANGTVGYYDCGEFYTINDLDDLDDEDKSAITKACCVN